MMTSHTLVRRNEFPSTSWTLVIAAANQLDQGCHEALVRLCERYWYPVYAYVRRRGYAEADAQDLTQDFFLRILEGGYLDRADPNRGRFRSFLLNSCRFFLADQADRNRAQKRGSGTVLPFEVATGEQRYQLEPLENETPDRIFEHRWALVLLDRVVSCLRDEFVQHGSVADFEKLKVSLLGQAEVTYAKLACELRTTEGGLKVAIHRLRKRYRVLFLREITETVANPAEVDSEIRFYFRSFGLRINLLLALLRIPSISNCKRVGVDNKSQRWLIGRRRLSSGS